MQNELVVVFTLNCLPCMQLGTIPPTWYRDSFFTASFIRKTTDGFLYRLVEVSGCNIKNNISCFVHI